MFMGSYKRGMGYNYSYNPTYNYQCHEAPSRILRLGKQALGQTENGVSWDLCIGVEVWGRGLGVWDLGICHIVGFRV